MNFATLPVMRARFHYFTYLGMCSVEREWYPKSDVARRVAQVPRREPKWHSVLVPHLDLGASTLPLCYPPMYAFQSPQNPKKSC